MENPSAATVLEHFRLLGTDKVEIDPQSKMLGGVVREIIESQQIPLAEVEKQLDLQRGSLTIYFNGYSDGIANVEGWYKILEYIGFKTVRLRYPIFSANNPFICVDAIIVHAYKGGMDGFLDNMDKWRISVKDFQKALVNIAAGTLKRREKSFLKNAFNFNIDDVEEFHIIEGFSQEYTFLTGEKPDEFPFDGIDITDI